MKTQATVDQVPIKETKRIQVLPKTKRKMANRVEIYKRTTQEMKKSSLARRWM